MIISKCLRRSIHAPQNCAHSQISSAIFAPDANFILAQQGVEVEQVLRHAYAAEENQGAA